MYEGCSRSPSFKEGQAVLCNVAGERCGGSWLDNMRCPLGDSLLCAPSWSVANDTTAMGEDSVC